jgi:hypothetical protein
MRPVANGHATITVMSDSTESKIERERRVWLEEGERLKDLEEDYQAARAAGTPTDELKHQLTETRRTYRTRGEQSGKRAGMVAVTTIWWKRWLEVGIDHELTARDGFRQLLGGHNDSANLLVDFDNSVVAVCSAAFAIEALYNDFVYRLPPKEWDKRPNQIQRVGYGLRTGWQLDESSATRLVSRIGRLLKRRGDAVHAYPETLPARPHPAGLHSGAEHEVFNAVTAGEALDLAIEVVDLTAGDPSPDLPNPYDRWMRRWVSQREAHHAEVRGMQTRRKAVPFQLPGDAG